MRELETLSVKGDGLPSFIGIGGQRCGSTSLWNLLRADQRLFLPDRKELHYFSNRDDEYREDLANYRPYFADALRGQLIGEFTPNYLTSAGACMRIKSHLPDVKLLVVLRDPVSRAVSHYNYRVMRGQESRSMRSAMHADMKRCVEGDEVTNRHYAYCQMGMYGLGLNRYIQSFGRSKILVMLTDDLKNGSHDVRHCVGEFLELESGLALGSGEQQVANKIATHPRIRSLEVWAQNTLRGNRERDGIWARSRCGVARRVKRLNRVQGTISPPDALKEELRGFFERDTELLSQMLDFELPWAK
tara:strand:- start:983 stop:1888 length:906 start_codon:yes stop_codon:yes gene_type:complete